MTLTATLYQERIGPTWYCNIPFTSPPAGVTLDILAQDFWVPGIYSRAETPQFNGKDLFREILTTTDSTCVLWASRATQDPEQSFICFPSDPFIELICFNKKLRLVWRLSFLFGFVFPSPGLHEESWERFKSKSQGVPSLPLSKNRYTSYPLLSSGGCSVGWSWASCFAWHLLPVVLSAAASSLWVSRHHCQKVWGPLRQRDTWPWKNVWFHLAGAKSVLGFVI